MRIAFAAAACTALAAACSQALAASPFEQFRGKMKAGMYETRMQMQIPGMPAGMGPQMMTFQNCVTQEDIDKGEVGKGRDGKGPTKCDVKDFKMSGDTATYKTICTGETAVTADNTITFRDSGYTMDMKMAMNRGGKVTNMSQKMEGRYLGPCKQ